MDEETTGGGGGSGLLEAEAEAKPRSESEMEDSWQRSSPSFLLRPKPPRMSAAVRSDDGFIWSRSRSEATDARLLKK